jgi:effector-binding domain-containing protein
MNIEIKNNFVLTLHGFSAIAKNNDYSGTAFQLSDRMWNVVKENNLKSKGINIWVYEADHKVFAGVELEDITGNDYGLEKKKIFLEKYACYKHVGPYKLISQAGQEMRNELEQKGYEITMPYIEIYGHWASDENKSETELIMCLK